MLVYLRASDEETVIDRSERRGQPERKKLSVSLSNGSGELASAKVLRL